VTQTTSPEAKERPAVESPAHMVLGLVAALVALVMAGIALTSSVNPSSVPAAAGEHTNPVAAATEQ